MSHLYINTHTYKTTVRGFVPVNPSLPLATLRLKDQGLLNGARGKRP